MEKILSRISAIQQFANEKSDTDFGRRHRASPSLNPRSERWSSGIDALRNKIAERNALFQGPLFPCRRYPLKLRAQIEDHPDVKMTVEPRKQLSHSRSGQVFGAQDDKVICLTPSDGRNLIPEPLREILRFLFRVLQSPYRGADEIASLPCNPQVFVENKNILLLQLAKILKERRPDAGAAALCESRMKYDASHVENLTTDQADSTDKTHPKELQACASVARL